MLTVFQTDVQVQVIVRCPPVIATTGGGVGEGVEGVVAPTCRQGGKRYQIPHHFGDLVE